MAIMFRGHFTHAIDAKGRTALPARFRDALAPTGDGRLVLTPALFDPCVHLYPLRAWEELEGKVARLPQFDANVVRFRRLYVSAAIDCELDAQGRVLVPPQLRQHAGLAKEVLWAGVGDKAELWDKERWEAEAGRTPEVLGELRDAMAQWVL
jgi:MraZ protein